MKKLALISAATALFLIAVAPVSASHIQDVLGDQTSASEIAFPPVTAGAGMILPDSPFYAVDKFSQQVKLATALTPERKAQVRMLVIGERLAELRVMTQRNNTAAIKDVLSDIGVQSELMANELSDAGSQGRDVTTIAQSINNTLRQDRVVLKAVAEQADAPLALDVESARQALLVAKVRVEEQLPETQMLAAMDDDLEDEVETHVLGVQTATDKLEKRLTQLDVLADKAVKNENRAAIQALREKRNQLREQIKTNNKNNKDAVKKLRDARKETKQAIKNLKPTITCVRANFKNQGLYTACVAKQKKQASVTVTPSPSPITTEELSPSPVE